MQKLKFMQEFIFEINVECQHSSLHAKVLMHNCARAKHAKTCFVAYKGFWKLSRVENKCVWCTYTRATNSYLWYARLLKYQEMAEK